MGGGGLELAVDYVSYFWASGISDIRHFTFKHCQAFSPNKVTHLRTTRSGILGQSGNPRQDPGHDLHMVRFGSTNQETQAPKVSRGLRSTMTRKRVLAAATTTTTTFSWLPKCASRLARVDRLAPFQRGQPTRGARVQRLPHLHPKF